jgi:hypothetical protein
MLERYTFTFEKSPASDGSQAISGIVVSDRKGTQVKMRDVRRSLSDFVRKLINLCYNMPALPERAKLSLEITYTENCPSEYHAPYFPHSGTTTARFPDDERCEKQTVGVGKLNAGFHSVALKVSHLELAPNDVNNTIAHANEGENSVALQIPNDLQYGPATDKFDDIDADFSAHRDNILRESPPPSRTPLNSSPISIPRDPAESLSSSLQDETVVEPARSPTLQQAPPSGSRQKSEVSEVTLQLRTKDKIAASRYVSNRLSNQREQLRNMVDPTSIVMDQPMRC